MLTRPVSTGELLTTKQRLCIFHETSVSAEEALAFEDSELTYDLIKEKGAKAENMAAAGVGPKILKQMGLPSAKCLRTMGFDALYLADSKFASEANAAFGSDAIKDAFLVGASDAVALAGSETVGILGISVSELLDVCAGAPTEAASVLEQMPRGVSLDGVECKVILDTGLRKTALMELGYSVSGIVKQTGANAADLEKLGFGLK